MSVLPEYKINFFVFVIESPSSVDLYHRRSEGDIIQQAANLNQIPCLVKTTIDYETFEASLKIGLVDAMKYYKGSVPMLHISAHGFAGGIQLSNECIVKWDQLAELLRPINAALKGTLLLCLSCCEGLAGIKMALTKGDKGHPFFAIIGNSEKPLWSDTAVAYSTFYHLIAKGHYITDAVAGMKVASGNDKFRIEQAEEAKQSYLDFISTVNTQKAQEKLEENKKNEKLEHLEKLVTLSDGNN